MANRYLRATGNWNGAVWASTSGGTAGSAATPTANDAVYISANYTVTLTADAECGIFTINSGRINLNGNKMEVMGYIDDPEYGVEMPGQFIGSYSGSYTIDLSGGHLIIHSKSTATEDACYFWSYSTLISTDSIVELKVGRKNNPNGPDVMFDVGNGAMSDVKFDLGHYGSGGATINITGSPTFRSLIIQSKNSAAHTVRLDDSAIVTTDKLLLVGSSTSNKLKIEPTYNTELPWADITVTDGGSCYGQFVSMEDIESSSSSNVPLYIGSNSVTFDSIWLTQDPPKISTLVDPLTTAPGSNPNWDIATYSGASTPSLESTGAGGGGYKFENKQGVTSAGTYDILDEYFTFELNGMPLTDSNQLSVTMGFFTGPDGTWDNLSARGLFSQVLGFSAGESLDAGDDPGLDWHVNENRGPYNTYGGDLVEGPTTQTIFARMKVNSSNGDAILEYSVDGGLTWSSPLSKRSFPLDSLVCLRAVRIFISTSTSGSYSSPFTIGSIGMLPNLSPTVALNTPANNANTTNNPSFTFTGTDPEGNALTYQIQIDTVNTFDSQGGN